MAKKRQNLDLKNKNIKYDENGVTHEVIYLKASSMTVDVKCYEKGEYTKTITLPFAHLPKKIKSLINPL